MRTSTLSPVADEKIAVLVVPSTFGYILVAATSRGVCCIELGDDEQTLTQQLRTRFPKASFGSGTMQLQAWASKVLSYIEHPVASLELPLDIQGSAFQCAVWQALRDIPVGKTVSYTDVAASVGRPTAMRAVAQACAANPLAVVVPCHRVLRRDGGLSGYRWGTERKAELLRRESQAWQLNHDIVKVITE
jgi:AraC family transcriptional regulator of adaptative response/methylated-DNA-[protein]-cysteine methyltransferase